MNDADKQKVLIELNYEASMFNKTALYIIQYHPSKHVVKDNAYIESFLLHARNIVDFLEDEKYENDLKCSDFGIRKQKIKLPVLNSHSNYIGVCRLIAYPV